MKSNQKTAFSTADSHPLYAMHIRGEKLYSVCISAGLCDVQETSCLRFLSHWWWNVLKGGPLTFHDSGSTCQHKYYSGISGVELRTEKCKNEQLCCSCIFRSARAEGNHRRYSVLQGFADGCNSRCMISEEPGAPPLLRQETFAESCIHSYTSRLQGNYKCVVTMLRISGAKFSTVRGNWEAEQGQRDGKVNVNEETTIWLLGTQWWLGEVKKEKSCLGCVLRVDSCSTEPGRWVQGAVNAATGS